MQQIVAIDDEKREIKRLWGGEKMKREEKGNYKEGKKFEQREQGGAMWKGKNLRRGNKVARPRKKMKRR